jgi:hypothetical protein
MQNIGLGDVIFIILILGVVHGILHLVSSSRNRDSSSKDDPEQS